MADVTCQGCQSPISVGAAFCAKCGKKIPAQPLSRSAKINFCIGVFLCYVAGINAAHAGLASFEVLGATMATAGITFGIAFLVNGRQRPRDWDAVGKWFMWVSLLVGVAQATSKH